MCVRAEVRVATRTSRSPAAVARETARHRHADGDHDPGALYKRRETGEGHRLQVAMQDAMLHYYMRINLATQGLTGKAAERGGSKVPGVSNAPMGLYPCAPGGPNDHVYIMTSRANPDHWDRVLKLIDRKDLIGDKRYLTPADRVEREAEVDNVISVWTSTHTKLDAMKLQGDAGIPAGAVQG